MNNAVCEVCSLIWSLALYGGTAYLVFGLNHSAWWFALPLLVLPGWKCPQ